MTRLSDERLSELARGQLPTVGSKSEIQAALAELVEARARQTEHANLAGFWRGRAETAEAALVEARAALARAAKQLAEAEYCLVTAPGKACRVDSALTFVRAAARAVGGEALSTRSASAGWAKRELEATASEVETLPSYVTRAAKKQAES